MVFPAMLYYPAIAASSLVAFGTYIWFVKPDLMIKYMMRLYLRTTGMRVKYIKGKKYTYCYGERGQASSSHSSMVLIHGFSASKDMFTPVVKRLPNDLHIIAVDLTGHGGTTLPDDQDISVENMTDDLHEFTELVGLTKKPFHLVGTSLGGVVVTLFSLQHVELVERLSLVCPGFSTPVETEFSKRMDGGDGNLLVPQTLEDLVLMLDMCFFNKNVVPRNKQILLGTLLLRKQKNDYYLKLMDSLIRDKNNSEKHDRLEKEASKITCPTQIIFGKEDEIIHVSGADRLQKLLPNVQRVDLFDDCGHSINYDRPGLFVKSLLQFRGELTPTKKEE